MTALQISVFGKFQVRCGEQVLTGLEARKVQELFCYLLLFRHRSHPREILADLLWGDISVVNSKGYLRKALWQLQVALDTQGDSDVVLIEADWVQLNPQTDLWLDVAVFEQAFTLVQGVPGEKLDDRCAQTLRSAVDLYQGDLLEGWYPEWCLYERERLQHLYLSMLDKLMSYSESRQEYETGMIYGLQALRYDRARERTHRRLMRLQYLAGDRTAALRQYERCVAALEEELGVKPARRTTTLFEQIWADQPYEPTPPPVKARQVEIAPLFEVLDRLQLLQTVLDDAQRQVQQNIQAVKLFMNNWN